MKVPNNIIKAIKDHSIKKPKEEVCGYWLVNENKIIECENVTELDKSNNFLIDVDKHLEITNQYENVVIYHTHCLDSISSILSYQDIGSSKALRIPYLLVHTEFNEIDYYDPTNVLNAYPLKDNPYHESTLDYYLGHANQWDRWDCLSIFRAYYKGVLNIDISDFNRKGEENIILTEGWNLLLDNYVKEGFRALEYGEPLQDNDVAFMCLIGDNVHHIAVIYDAKNNRAIHCLGEENISKEFCFSDSHKRRTRLYIRHNSLDC